MSATESSTVRVGRSLPKIASIMVGTGRFEVAITWRAGGGAVVDLAPDIFTFKVYAPLRDDADLFKTVHVLGSGSAIGWGNDDQIDMPATAIERLAAEEMTTEDFQGFLKISKLTRDAAAAQLGISRRLVGYYAAGHRIPRYISLACAQLASKPEQKSFSEPAFKTERSPYETAVQSLLEKLMKGDVITQGDIPSFSLNTNSEKRWTNELFTEEVFRSLLSRSMPKVSSSDF